MKKVFFLTAIICMSISLNAQKLWKVYTPVQSDLIGSSVNGYNNKTLEIALNPFTNNFTYKTSEGSNRDFKEFKKRSAIDIIGFVSNNIKVQTIDAKGKIYVDQLENPTKLIPGVTYVYAGLRSDSVTVTIEKTSNNEIKLDEIISAANTIGLKLDSSIVNTNWADSIKFNKERKATFSIANPKVYYSIQLASIAPGKLSDKWIQTFNSGTPNEQDTTTLSFQSGQDQSKIVTPVGGNNTLKLWLAVEKDNNNANALFVKSSEGDLIKLDKNRLGNSEWFYSRTPIKVYETGRNSYKVVLLDLEAKPAANGDIIISKSIIRYPDAKLKVLKRI